MARLIKLEKVVKKILEDDELARKDDCYLILQVISKLYPHEIGKKFETVMFGAKSKGISFESITRCRRKLQEKHTQLKDEETAKARGNKKKEYINYSRQK